MMPFGFPLDRRRLPDREDLLENAPHISINLPSGKPDIAQCNEAAARILTHAAKRLRNGESVRDVCGALVDTVIALSGRV